MAGNLIITAARLSDAPRALRSRVAAGLAALPTKPITRIPPPLPCVRRPDLCVDQPPSSTTIARVIGVENHHGLNVRQISVSSGPPRYRDLIPPGFSITAAATNAGDSAAIARRGYVFSMTFDRPLPFVPTYVAFRQNLGHSWGVFPDVNVLTLFHPLRPERGKRYGHNNTGYAVLHDLDRLTGSPWGAVDRATVSGAR